MRSSSGTEAWTGWSSSASPPGRPPGPAPVEGEEFPVAMECELLEIVDTENLHCVIGRIVGVSADERVLDSKGKIDPAKLNAFVFDQFQNGTTDRKSVV